MQTPRKQHYNFAYFTMPLLVLSNTNETFKKLDRNDRVSYLRTLWKGLGNKTGENLPDNGLDCYKQKLDNTKTLFVIELPPPQIQPEALYVGLVFDVESVFFSSKSTKARCFTLELSKDIPSRTEVYVIGEMVHGKSFPNFDHKNYGSVACRDMETFINFIQGILTKQREPSPIPLKGSARKQSIQQGNSQPKNDPEQVVEAEFNRIWEKWTYLIKENPVYIQGYEKSIPVEKYLKQLGQSCIGLNVPNLRTMNDVEEAINWGLSRLCRGSFIIGIEQRSVEIVKGLISSIGSNRLLELTEKSALMVMAMFISHLQKAGKITSKDGHDMVMQGGFLISACGQAFYRLGYESYFQSMEPSPEPENLFKGLGNQESGAGIGDVDNAGEGSIAGCIQALRDPKTRAQASLQLVNMGHKAVHVVRPLLRDLNPEVRSTALDILTNIEKNSL